MRRIAPRPTRWTPPARVLALQKSFVAALVLCSLLSFAAIAQAAELASEKTTAIDAAVAKFMAEKRVPGLSAAIVTEGRLSLERG